MNFMLGLAVIGLMILALVGLVKLTGAFMRGVRRAARSVVAAQVARRLQLPSRTEVAGTWDSAVCRPRAADWLALSKDLRQTILARGVRAGVHPRLAELDAAIEIAKREIELARLTAEQTELRRQRRRSTTKPTATANPRRQIPQDHLDAWRQATGSGKSTGNVRH